MQFRAFSSRIEARAFFTIALLSLVPTAVLGYGAYRHLEAESARNVEIRLLADLAQFNQHLNARLSDLVELARNVDEPASLQKSPFVDRVQAVAPANLNSASTGSRARLLYDGNRLWLTPQPSLWLRLTLGEFLRNVEQREPTMAFCVRFNASASSTGCTASAGLDPLNLRHPLRLTAGLQSNFEADIRVNGDPALAVGGTSHFPRMMLWSLLLASILGVATATLSLRRQLAPLAEFRRGTEALSQQDYGVRLDIRTEDEFESLGATFNQMTETLSNSVGLMQTLSEIDQLILKTTDLEKVIRAVLNAIHSVRPGSAWVLTLGHDNLPAERLYHVDHLGALQWADTQGWSSEMPLIPALADFEPDKMREMSGLPVDSTYPVQLDEHLVAVVLVGAQEGEQTSGLGAQRRQTRNLRELADRLSVAMTHIDRSLTLYRQANQDALTGLINRQAFERELRRACERCERENSYGALLFLDLDRFKQVNDTEGHKAGDKLLVVFARRLQQSLRPGDIIARLGGDEFAVILQSDRQDIPLIETCERIISKLAKPVIVERLEHSIHASIGIAHISATSASADQVLMHADVAMYHAKTKAGRNYAFYDPALHSESEQRIELESRLRQALSSNDISLHFQPQLDLATGTIRSLEGLLRWSCPVKGDIPPSLFIPIAEESGIIHDLEPIIFEHAARMIARTESNGYNVERVAVNASVQQIMLPGFARRVLRYLGSSGMRPTQLEIEVTESLFIKETELVVAELEELRASGIAIALDDFGTGYSSLNLVRTLPIDVIKIDRSFVLELVESAQANDLVESIIRIARTLNKTVVAEGVETRPQLNILRALQCDTVQGYALAKPLAPTDLLNLLAGHEPARWVTPQVAAGSNLTLVDPARQSI